MTSRLLVGLCGAALLTAACGQTDAGITTAVKTQLATDDVVKARQINVDTRDRVVTLTGEVRTPEEEAKALQIARSSNGVRDVVDQITVVPGPQATPTTGIVGTPGEPVASRTDDASITTAVKSKLLADPDTSGLRIDVDTKDQVVTLKGTVANQAEKREAVEIAKGTDGVKSVTDRLTIRQR